MKMALISDEQQDYRGPETFSRQEAVKAAAHGVLLEVISSKTAGENYLANICPHCNEFIGKWYFFANYYAPAMYGQLSYKNV